MPAAIDGAFAVGLHVARSPTAALYPHLHAVQRYICSPPDKAVVSDGYVGGYIRCALPDTCPKPVCNRRQQTGRL